MLESILIVVIWFLAVWGFWFWVRFFLQYSKSDRSRPLFPSPFGLLDVCIIFAAWLLAPGIVAGGFLYSWGQTELASLSNEQSNILIGATAITQLFTCIAACWYYTIRYKSVADIFGLEAAAFRTHCRIAAKSFVMIVPGLLGLQWLLSQLVPYEHSTISQLQGNFSLSTLLVTWLGAVVAAPICEELLFRCVLQGWLQRIGFRATINQSLKELTGGWDLEPASDCEIVLSDGDFDRANPFAVRIVKAKKLNSENRLLPTETTNVIRWWLPVVISSALFAAVHVGQGLAPVSLFLFGLVLGFLYRQTGSIVPSIGLHFLLNAFSMFWVTIDATLAAINDAI